MSKKYAYALHSVHLGKQIIDPATVFDAGDHFDELKSVGAVREASDDEVVLYQHANPDPLDHDGDGKKGGTKPKAEADAKAKAAADAAADL